MKEIRPTIKPSLSPLDNRLELTSKIFFTIVWSLALYSYLKLPTTIPVHYNAYGQPNGYGDKMMLLILPILATAIYFGLTQLNKYPHIFNYLTKITEANAVRQYTIATRMLRLMKLVILLIFSIIILLTYLTSIGITKGLGIWFLPLISGLLLIPTIVSISLSLKKKIKVA